MRQNGIFLNFWMDFRSCVHLHKLNLVYNVILRQISNSSDSQNFGLEAHSDYFRQCIFNVFSCMLTDTTFERKSFLKYTIFEFHTFIHQMKFRNGVRFCRKY